MIHPTAIINCEPMRSKSFARTPADHPESLIPEGTCIGPYAVIYRGVIVGNDVVIGEKASVREGARIGDGCVVGMAAQVGHDVVLGKRVKVQNLAFVVGGTRVGDDTFIGQGVITTNDDDPSDYRPKKLNPPIIGARCMIGAGAIIRGGITIGDGAIIAMGSLVVSDVSTGATVMGDKARPIRR